MTWAARAWFSTHYSESFTNVLHADTIKRPFTRHDWDIYKLRPISSSELVHSTGNEKSDLPITTKKIRVCAKTGKDSSISPLAPLVKGRAISNGDPSPAPTPPHQGREPPDLLQSPFLLQQPSLKCSLKWLYIYFCGNHLKEPRRRQKDSFLHYRSERARDRK